MVHALQPSRRPVIPQTKYGPGVKKAILKLGPPGCGKGTQTEFLRTTLGITTLEMGPFLKMIRANDPALKAGALINDDIVRYQVKLWIHRHISARQIVIDGCPRTKEQVSLIDFLKERGYTVCTIWFDTPTQVCVDRLLKNPRPGREEDRSPTITTRRADDYMRLTLPIRDQVLNMSDAYLTIDNTHLSPQTTRAKMLHFIRQHVDDHEGIALHAARTAHVLAEPPRHEVMA